MAQCNKNENCVRKRPAELSSKSTTAANVHLMECPLDNWLKNNYITVDMIHCLRSVLVSGIFYEF